MIDIRKMVKRFICLKLLLEKVIIVLERVLTLRAFLIKESLNRETKA